jgi:hypothetical protein
MNQNRECFEYNFIGRFVIEERVGNTIDEVDCMLYAKSPEI